jgi:TetR/AcrR family transcriptional regulator
MAITNKDAATEELIKETAKKIFFKEGKFNATTQEIADAAGVNRTLINYYFRSRNTLFDLVFKEAREEEDRKQEMIIQSKLPLKEKIAQFIDYFFESAKEYPYKEIYIVTQINQSNGCIFKDEVKIDRLLKKFYTELEKEMEKGTIQKMDPIQFLLNFISMLSFPIGMRPLVQRSLKLTDTEYEEVLSSRKEVILNTLFGN